MRTYPPPKLVIGDKVAYSVQFLRSIGMSHTPMSHARGVVTGFTPLGKDTTLVAIQWDCEMPKRVNIFNLAKVGPNARFANVD